MRVRQDNEATHRAVAEVVQTGERLVANSLSLLRHDVMDEVHKVGTKVASLAASAVFGFAAFVTLSVGLALALTELMPGYQATLCLGAGYAAVAGGLVVLAKRRDTMSQRAEQAKHP